MRSGDDSLRTRGSGFVAVSVSIEIVHVAGVPSCVGTFHGYVAHTVLQELDRYKCMALAAARVSMQTMLGCS